MLRYKYTQLQSFQNIAAMNHVWPGGERYYYRTKSCCLNFLQLSRKCSSCSRGGANSCRIKALTRLKHVKRYLTKDPIVPFVHNLPIVPLSQLRFTSQDTRDVPQYVTDQHSLRSKRVCNSCLCQIQPITLPGHVKVQSTQSQHSQFWHFGCQSTLISTNEFKSSNKSLISTRH